MIEHKIILTGTTGAGKTTAIRAISEVAPINSDVRNTDPEFAKATTTTGLDYGELTLDNGERLRLVGTPGQKRFEHMWQVLARGALGVVVLVDNARPQPLADLDIYLDGFRDLIRDGACVVGIGRMEQHPSPGIDDYARHLALHGVLCPVLPVDVREGPQVAQLLDLLLLQLESRVSG